MMLQDEKQKQEMEERRRIHASDVRKQVTTPHTDCVWIKIIIAALDP